LQYLIGIQLQHLFITAHNLRNKLFHKAGENRAIDVFTENLPIVNLRNRNEGVNSLNSVDALIEHRIIVKGFVFKLVELTIEKALKLVFEFPVQDHQGLF
jgi:hypothetical protein